MKSMNNTQHNSDLRWNRKAGLASTASSTNLGIAAMLLQGRGSFSPSHGRAVVGLLRYRHLWRWMEIEIWADRSSQRLLLAAKGKRFRSASPSTLQWW